MQSKEDPPEPVDPEEALLSIHDEAIDSIAERNSITSIRKKGDKQEVSYINTTRQSIKTVKWKTCDTDNQQLEISGELSMNDKSDKQEPVDGNPIQMETVEQKLPDGNTSQIIGDEMATAVVTQVGDGIEPEDSNDTETISDPTEPDKFSDIETPPDFSMSEQEEDVWTISIRLSAQVEEALATSKKLSTQAEEALATSIRLSMQVEQIQIKPNMIETHKEKTISAGIPKADGIQDSTSGIEQVNLNKSKNATLQETASPDSEQTEEAQKILARLSELAKNARTMSNRLLAQANVARSSSILLNQITDVSKVQTTKLSSLTDGAQTRTSMELQPDKQKLSPKDSCQSHGDPMTETENSKYSTQGNPQVSITGADEKTELPDQAEVAKTASLRLSTQEEEAENTSIRLSEQTEQARVKSIRLSGQAEEDMATSSELSALTEEARVTSTRFSVPFETAIERVSTDGIEEPKVVQEDSIAAHNETSFLSPVGEKVDGRAISIRVESVQEDSVAAHNETSFLSPVGEKVDDRVISIRVESVKQSPSHITPLPLNNKGLFKTQVYNVVTNCARPKEHLPNAETARVKSDQKSDEDTIELAFSIDDSHDSAEEYVDGERRQQVLKAFTLLQQMVTPDEVQESTQDKLQTDDEASRQCFIKCETKVSKETKVFLEAEVKCGDFHDTIDDHQYKGMMQQEFEGPDAGQKGDGRRPGEHHVHRQSADGYHSDAELNEEIDKDAELEKELSVVLTQVLTKVLTKAVTRAMSGVMKRVMSEVLTKALKK